MTSRPRVTQPPPGDTPRIVKPRKRNPTTWRYVIAIAEEEILLERTGEVIPASDLAAVITAEPSSIIACQGFGRHLQRLQLTLGEEAVFNSRFQYRVTPRYRDNRRSNTRVLDTVVNFVGFMADENKKNAKYHYPLDPVHFIRASIDELRGDETQWREGRLNKLLEWAKEVRDWCHINQLEVRPSSGGLVAQLLRDPRFYPRPRRKVPGLINDISRSQLPGNYYRLHAERGRRYRAIYLDMTSAHHQAASVIHFPDANSLRAHGLWSRHESGRLYATGTAAELPHLQRPGLFKLRITVPHLPATKFPPPWAERGGTHDVWIYSNELPILQELRIGVDGLICALTAHSAEPDGEGMRAYARWAREEIRKRPDLKPWLKPTLHSTYGILAARPAEFETGYLRAKGGTPTMYPMGPVSIPAKAKSGSYPVESRIANVIHRGMIEAEIRKEALWMARFLTEADGRQVLSIYADSVFIRDNGVPMKLLPPWWRISEYCSDLQFMDATHFRSKELVRLPGLARNRRDARRMQYLVEREKVSNESRRGTRPKRKRDESGRLLPTNPLPEDVLARRKEQ